MKRSYVLLVCLSFLALTCSYSGGGGDGGPGDGDGGRPDYDPSGSFLLVIPEGTVMCSGFSEGRDEAGELAVLSTLELAAGFYVLDREEGTSQVGGFIRQVILGLDKQVAEPTASTGTLEAALGGWDTWKDWTYTLTVPMLLGGTEAEARFKFHISAEWGMGTG